MTPTPSTTGPFRAVYIGTCAEPVLYSLGIANHTTGFDDPESAEHLAWWFKPDDDESLYYVDEKELSFDPYEIAVRDHVQTKKADDKITLGRYLGYERCPDTSFNVLFEFHSFSLNSLLQQPLRRLRGDHERSLDKLGFKMELANTRD
jgi:hypothetical protein